MQRCTSCLNGSLSIIIDTIKLRSDHQRSAAHALGSRASPRTKPLCSHEKTTAKPHNRRASTNTYKQVIERRSGPNHHVNPPGAPGSARGWRMFQLTCWARSVARQLMKLPPAYWPYPTCPLWMVCGRGQCGHHARRRRVWAPQWWPPSVTFKSQKPGSAHSLKSPSPDFFRVSYVF